MRTRLKIPELLGGVAHGLKIPVNAPEPIITKQTKDERFVNYILYIANDPDLGWIEFFAPEDTSQAMRDGWLNSWLKAHPEWPGPLIAIKEFDLYCSKLPSCRCPECLAYDESSPL